MATLNDVFRHYRESQPPIEGAPDGAGGLTYETNCVGSTAELIGKMQTAATEVSRRKFLRVVNRASLTAVERSLGYDTGTERGGLRMSKDWAVSYHLSFYDGRRCAYFVHSHIEYIFC